MMTRLVEMTASIATVPSRALTWIAGGIVGVLAPTVPFIAICMFAIVADCISAWRLSKRAAKNHPNAKHKGGGKFQTEYAKRIFGTLYVISMCIFLGHCIDVMIFEFMELHLVNWISGAFALVQLLSILENESSENDATWAKTLQKVLINKVSRHLDIDEDVFKETKQKPRRKG